MNDTMTNVWDGEWEDTATGRRIKGFGVEVWTMRGGKIAVWETAFNIGLADEAIDVSQMLKQQTRNNTPENAPKSGMETAIAEGISPLQAPTADIVDWRLRHALIQTGRLPSTRRNIFAGKPRRESAATARKW